MRAVILIVFLCVAPIVALLVVFAEPAQAARVYRLDHHRIEVYRNGRAVTIEQYLAWRQEAVFASTTNFSNRKGAPAGLFILKGYVHQGNFRRRCFFQVDRTGRRVWIGYQLKDWAYHAFEAGPCLTRWTKKGQSGVYIAEQAERFTHSFVTANADRSVLCLDRQRSTVHIFRFRGSLWLMGQKMTPELDRCINLDGGGQLGLQAINPAVLGIVRDSLEH